MCQLECVCDLHPAFLARENISATLDPLSTYTTSTTPYPLHKVDDNNNAMVYGTRAVNLRAIQSAGERGERREKRVR